MAYSDPDSSVTFTISLTALLEGLGNLYQITVVNNTTAIDYIWEYGAWTTPLPEATEGDSITIGAYVSNEGDVTDTLFGEFSSAQVTPTEALIQEMPNVAVGFDSEVVWNFAMPPNNVTITINAGHVE